MRRRVSRPCHAPSRLRRRADVGAEETAAPGHAGAAASSRARQKMARCRTALTVQPADQGCAAAADASLVEQAKRRAPADVDCRTGAPYARRQWCPGPDAAPIGDGLDAQAVLVEPHGMAAFEPRVDAVDDQRAMAGAVCGDRA